MFFVLFKEEVIAVIVVGVGWCCSRKRLLMSLFGALAGVALGRGCCCCHLKHWLWAAVLKRRGYCCHCLRCWLLADVVKGRGYLLLLFKVLATVICERDCCFCCMMCWLVMFMEDREVAVVVVGII